MRPEDMSKDQIRRLSKIEDPKEVMAFLEEEGIELTDEQLAAIAGGQEVSSALGLALGEH